MKQQANMQVIKEQDPEAQNCQGYHRYQYSVAIQKIAKIHQRVCSRKFMKQILFIYIASLKNVTQVPSYQHNIPQKDNKKSISKIDWPFKDLFLMRNKTPQQQMLMQFVHMCATKVQTFFKLYITRKRHLQAIKRIKKIVNAINTLKRSWKTSRILGCKRVKQIRDNIKRINSQIDFEQRNPQRNAKKIQYLYEEAAHSQEELKRFFHKLYKSGLWVFQINPIERIGRQEKARKAGTKIVRKKTQKNLDIPIRPSNVEKLETNRSSQSQKNQNNQFINIPVPLKQKYQPKIMNKNQTRKTSQNINSSRFDQIPIKSKGAYVVDENQSQTQEKEQIKFRSKNQNQQIQQSRNRQKSKEKQKATKRQKYDPRKAIQQAKQKKKLQQIPSKDAQLLKQQSSKQQKATTYNLQNIESLNQQDNRKTVKNVKNAGKKNANPGLENKSLLSQKPKAKAVVQSKVKCWNKKPSNNQNYSAHFQQNGQYIGKQDQNQVQQRRFKRIEELLSFTNSNQNDPRIQKQPTHFQAQKKVQNLGQREDASTDKYQRLKSNFNNNMKEIMQKISQQRKKQVKKEAYRPFQQLQDAYNNQYGARYQSLMPKLGLLSVARRAQRGKAIPVISQNSQIIKSLMGEMPKNFWKSAKIIEQRFKQAVQ